MGDELGSFLSSAVSWPDGARAPIATVISDSDRDHLLQLARSHADKIIEFSRQETTEASINLVLMTGSSDLQLLKDLHRVAKRGCRVLFAGLVSDEPYAGMQTEDRLFASFADAGFYGVVLLKRDQEPHRTVERVEVRRVVLAAYKGKEGECWEHFQSVMYKGPFSSVTDDDHHTYFRGIQTAVCAKTYALLGREPYASHFVFSEPAVRVVAPTPFPCDVPFFVRDPKQIKRARPEKKQHRILLVERSGSPGDSRIRDFAAAIAERFGQHAEIDVIDPNDADDPNKPTIPGQLRLRLTLIGDRALPAVAVDGVLITTGKLPVPEAIDRALNNGVPFGAAAYEKENER